MILVVRSWLHDFAQRSVQLLLRTSHSSHGRHLSRVFESSDRHGRRRHRMTEPLPGLSEPAVASHASLKTEMSGGQIRERRIGTSHDEYPGNPVLLKWGDHPICELHSTLSGDEGHPKRTRVTERSIHHEREGCFATQGRGIGTCLVCCIHDVPGLSWIDPWEECMNLHRETHARVIIFNQAHQGADRGLNDRGTHSSGRVDQRPVVAG